MLKRLRGVSILQFELQVPLSGGEALRLSVSKGDILFVLGANGTGKSSLMHHFYTMYIAQSRRITAHRQTFFLPNMFTLSLDQKRQAEKNILASDQGLNARWTDQYGYQRLNLAISNLVDHEIMRSIKIARAADGGDTDLMRQLCSSQAPLSVVNELLCLSNLPIEVSIGENQQPMASRNGSAPYPVAELSDGERNALLMASTVLTAKPGEILIIDEPERHLHRSIISPLLTHLFAKRDDCAFVVSTHEVMLPLDNPRSRTLLLRSCAVDRGSVQYWDADFAATDADVSEDLKKDILGARRRVLFVEGTDRSLDQALYSIVFPDITIIAKGSCRDVEHAVSSIRDAAQLHWVHPFGIVDGDGRDDQEVQRLKERGVYALRVFSIESVYYHPAILKAAAQRHADATGEDALSLMQTAKNKALAVARSHEERLSKRRAERAIREQLFRQLPGKREIDCPEAIQITIDIPAAVSAERKKFVEAVEDEDMLALIQRYPMRETPALNALVTGLGFRNRAQYESTVRRLLMDDPNLLTFVRSLFGTLVEDIEAE